MIESLLKTAKYLTLALPVAVVFSDHVVSVHAVHGQSMQPTFNPTYNRGKNDYILISRWNIRTHDYHKGEVVVLASPDDPHSYIVKRIIGVEGDWVRAKWQGKEKVRIPRGHCWVEGDNGTRSYDSKAFGPVAMALIEGRVTHIIWPPSQMGRVSRIIPARIHNQ